MRALLLLPAALLLVACGDCDCCKDKKAPVVTAGTERTSVDAPTSVEAPIAKKTALVSSPMEEEVRQDDEPAPPVVKVAWRGAGDVLEFSVWHMRCGGCEAHVEETLTKLDVGEVAADHKTSTVTVKLKDPAKRDVVIAKVRDALKAGEFRILGE
jgi:copper chaperone CopZ